MLNEIIIRVVSTVIVIIIIMAFLRFSAANCQCKRPADNRNIKSNTGSNTGAGTSLFDGFIS